MATLGALVATSQYTQPVAILRNYTKTDWQHQLGHRTSSQHQQEDKNRNRKNRNKLSSGFHVNPGMKHPATITVLRGVGYHNQNTSLITPEQNGVPIVKITISSIGRERKGACQGLLRFSVLFNVGGDIKV